VLLDFAEKRPEAAKARLEPLLAKTPDNPGLLILAARFYGSAGDLARAENLLRKLIEIDHTNFQAYLMLGQLYHTQRRRGEAIGTYEAILKDQPDSVPVNTIVGILQEAEGNHSEARKRYERVLQIDPQAAVAANNLAYIYAERGGNLDLALQLAQTAKQRMPDSPQVADTLGWIYLKKEMASLAIPQLEQATQGLPNNPLMFYHLGVALAKAGEIEKGRRALERALSLHLEPIAAAEARKLVAQL
jgi:tetratricopeptide (TPR) repeat protein